MSSGRHRRRDTPTRAVAPRHTSARATTPAERARHSRAVTRQPERARHAKAVEQVAQRPRRARQATTDGTRPLLAALAGVLAVAAALLTALVDDPRLLRLAVLLAIAAAIPFGIAATSGTSNRRLADEVATLRGLVEELTRRPQPLPPAVALAVASSAGALSGSALSSGAQQRATYTTVPITVTSERPDVPPVLDIDLRTPVVDDDPDSVTRPALRLPLVQAALRDAEARARAGEAPAGAPFVLDLAALEQHLGGHDLEQR
jgi:hypothetical protein